MFHLGVDRSQIELKLKVKTQISVFPWANIGQNDHSNPYIESTTVLSDNTSCAVFANYASNKHENLHVYIFYSWRVRSLVIFLLTLLLLVLLIVISTL